MLQLFVELLLLYYVHADGPTSNKGFVVETKVWIIGGSIVAGIVLLVVTVTVSIPVYIKFCRNK